jgi:vacuolar-type H+-ATPase subunit F/Vma7
MNPRTGHEAESGGRTRMIAMGSAALTEGFALVGFETWPDATEDELAEVLGGLLKRREKALVFLEPCLARCKCAELNRVQAEGGRIVVTEVPPLHAPGTYHPAVEEMVVSVLGPAALDDKR